MADEVIDLSKLNLLPVILQGMDTNHDIQATNAEPHESCGKPEERDPLSAYRMKVGQDRDRFDTFHQG